MRKIDSMIIVLFALIWREARSCWFRRASYSVLQARQASVSAASSDATLHYASAPSSCHELLFDIAQPGPQHRGKLAATFAGRSERVQSAFPLVVLLHQIVRGFLHGEKSQRPPRIIDVFLPRVLVVVFVFLLPPSLCTHMGNELTNKRVCVQCIHINMHVCMYMCTYTCV